MNRPFASFQPRVRPTVIVPVGFAVSLVAAAFLAITSATGAESRAPSAAGEDLALASINTGDILRHTRVLSADDFEGRAPGTAGEEKCVNYLITELKKIGLRPGNPDGTFIQKVPLVGSTAQPAISYRIGETKTELGFPQDAVVWTKRVVPEVQVEAAEMVFVGYGVIAPEYGWDDFKDVDVRGKTIVMLINDPAIPDPNDPTKLDEKMFKGRAMTYYAKDYHKVTDEVKPDWDFAGAVEDVQLLFQVGYAVAQGSQWPEWKPGTEFKARREEMLKSRR